MLALRSAAARSASRGSSAALRQLSSVAEPSLLDSVNASIAELKGKIDEKSSSDGYDLASFKADRAVNKVDMTKLGQTINFSDEAKKVRPTVLAPAARARPPVRPPAAPRSPPRRERPPLSSPTSTLPAPGASAVGDEDERRGEQDGGGQRRGGRGRLWRVGG